MPLADVKPGDLIGFSGSCIESDAINVGSLGWPRVGLSHIGIMAWDSQSCRPLMFESTSNSDADCEILRRRISGVQAHDLGDAVARYNGKVWIYRLYRALYEHENKRLARFVRSMLGRPYDFYGAFRSGGILLWAIESIFRSQDLSWLFCSEFAGAGLASTGVYPIANASRLSPNRLARRLLRAEIVRKPERLK